MKALSVTYSCITEENENYSATCKKQGDTTNQTIKDGDITQKLPILLEGILQDVFSQRASSAWQGAQPQKITVSLLLPGFFSPLPHCSRQLRSSTC